MISTQESQVFSSPDPIMALGYGRVRYKRVGKQRLPKNSLYTLAVNDRVYFGISRCRINGKTELRDIPSKREGSKLARERAYEAWRQFSGQKMAAFSVSEDFLSGYVSKNHIDMVLDYFYSFD